MVASVPQTHETPIERPPTRSGPRPTLHTPSDPLFHHPNRRQNLGSSDDLSSIFSSIPSFSPVPSAPPVRYSRRRPGHQLPARPSFRVYDPLSGQPHPLLLTSQRSVQGNPYQAPNNVGHHRSSPLHCHLPPRPAFQDDTAESLPGNDRNGGHFVTAAATSEDVQSLGEDSNSESFSNGPDSDTSLDQSDNQCQVNGILGAIRRFLFFGTKSQCDRPPRNALEECMLFPIQQQIMLDPVVDPDGHSYEREAILKWLERSSVSPITRRPLAAHQLKENRALKAVIHEYLNGGYSDKVDTVDTPA